MPKLLPQLLALFFLGSTTLALAQSGKIRGKILDASSASPIPFANVIVMGTTVGTSSDFDGNFELIDVPFGYFKLEVSVIGYKRGISEDVYVTQSKVPFVEIKLEPTSTQLKEVVIESSAFQKTEESPLSLQTLGIEEIERNPGGGRDVSRAIQSLPGVAATPGFRNDIIIRGGAPNENRFYIDDIETPLINHFQTQGSSGGPVGILNINLLREVNLYTAAFPSNRGNALSSVLEFKQLDGNKEKLNFRGAVGSSDLAIAFDGPIDDKTTFIASYRRSYLQFLFAALRLPFLPTYDDFQFKIKRRINANNEISLIGIGAIDDFALNLDVNKGLEDAEVLERNNYFLANLPINKQWSYTVGAVYKHYGEKSFQTIVVSRNALNNSAIKYVDNDESLPENKILDYSSTETENKIRLENTYRNDGFKLNLGVNLENAVFTNNTFNRIATPVGVFTRDFESELNLYKYGLFGQASQLVLKGRLTISGGFRFDGNSYNDEMANLFRHFSPRFSASFAITDKWSFNSNVGRYYQLPAYTILGFRDNSNRLVNQNRTKYIRSDHYVAGLQYNPDNSTKITVEGFYKDYAFYPFSLTDSISLANRGADFGVIGNEATASINQGRSYGIEFLIQRRAAKGLYGILAYTYVRSEFEDKNGSLVPSAWDSRNFVTLTAGKKFKKNYELGIKWRFAGGLPYTPYDLEASANIQNWDVSNQGIFDFNRLNHERFSGFSQLDIRVDKTWFLSKVAINLYFDIQNAYNYQSEAQAFLNVRTDANGNNLIDPNDPSKYQTYFIPNTNGTVLPTIGVIIDF